MQNIFIAIVVTQLRPVQQNAQTSLAITACILIIGLCLRQALHLSDYDLKRTQSLLFCNVLLDSCHFHETT